VAVIPVDCPPLNSQYQYPPLVKLHHSQPVPVPAPVFLADAAVVPAAAVLRNPLLHAEQREAGMAKAKRTAPQGIGGLQSGRGTWGRGALRLCMPVKGLGFTVHGLGFTVGVEECRVYVHALV
jgi:hypothetical protein